jgi:acyl-CoA thioesterase-1
VVARIGPSALVQRQSAFLGSGGTVNQLEAVLFGSPEYYRQAGGTAAGFLDALYQDVLGHHLTLRGWYAYLPVLRNAGAGPAAGAARLDVADQILQSAVDGRTSLVQRLCRHYLDHLSDRASARALHTALANGVGRYGVLAHLVASRGFLARVLARVTTPAEAPTAPPTPTIPPPVDGGPPAANAPAPPDMLSDPAFAPVVDDPALPRVLLIGDSVSIGYTVAVQKVLRGKANVHRIPDNGGATTYGLAHLSDWLGTGKWDVIHFNWGLHDLVMNQYGVEQVPLKQYANDLRVLVRRLKATGAKLVWGTTTPVPDYPVRPLRTNADVLAYNAAAYNVMAENGVAIDDLYNAVLPGLPQVQQQGNVHFTPAGYQELANSVAASIRAALGP